MNRTINILLILISALSYSQNSSESEIFKIIIDHEIGHGNLGIYLQCDKPKTFFDQKDFKEQTGLEVPGRILKELEKSAAKSKDGIWDSELMNDLKYGPDFIINKRCLSREEVEQLFEKTGKRQNIISISEPIFDKNYENCVVSVSYWNFTKSFYGHTYFLKKVYGVWAVVIVYETWMT